MDADLSGFIDEIKYNKLVLGGHEAKCKKTKLLSCQVWSICKLR